MREDGYYWVKRYIDSEWTILWFNKKYSAWHDGQEIIYYDDEELQEIDEKRIVR